MKKFLSLALTLLFLQGTFNFVLLPNSVNAHSLESQSLSQETLTNQTIIDMIASNLSHELIITKIKSTNNKFDTSAEALQNLKKAGVPDAIILAMVQKASGIEISSAGNSSISSAVNVIIPDGTEIKVMTTEDISGQKVVEGDPLTFKVAEEVIVNGATVIAKDTIVKGTVSSAKKKGFMGKGGDLSIRIESTQTVDNQKLKLRAAKSGQGGDNIGSTVALTVLFGPLGLLRRGKEAKIKAGTILSAYTDEVKTVAASK
ncbi:MAG TPA: hypothetical protein VK308_12360 [Pyrinomonadaceae bacterium]|nr:hypothetical protein [Pyrinomonadaceae bacterium]